MLPGEVDGTDTDAHGHADTLGPTSVSAMVTTTAGDAVVERTSDMRISTRPRGSAPPPQRAAFLGFVAMVVGIVAFGGLQGWSLHTTIHQARKESDGIAPAAAPRRAMTDPTPAPRFAPPAAAAPRTGVVTTFGATPGHRIYVDRRIVGQTPEDVTVPCGERRIRIGHADHTKVVLVPCDGAVNVEASRR